MQIPFSTETTGKQHIPWLMTALRAALGPVLIVGAASGWSPIGLAAMVITAFISDIFDGVLARRWHCDTPAVRLFDSMADTAFYLCAGVALWFAAPEALRANRSLLTALLSAEALRFIFDFAKFGKPASYHSYLAKSWGVMMAIAVTSAFALARNNTLMPLVLAVGIASNLETLAMSLILPVWRKDVKTLREAMRLRSEILGQSASRQLALPTLRRA